MTTYAQKLIGWSEALSAGRAEPVLNDLTADSYQRDIERFLENAIGERRRLLTEEMSLIALAFDDFDQLIEDYLAATPRMTFQLHETDQQRFLRWLRGRTLTSQQADFVTYQESEYACYELARKNRVAHLKFERLWKRSLVAAEEQSELWEYIVHANPVHVWTRLEIARGTDGSANEGDAVFLALNAQIKSLWLSKTQEKTARELMGQTPISLATWRESIEDSHVSTADKTLRELITGGLLALSSP